MAGSGGSQAETPLQNHLPGSGSLDRRSGEDGQEPTAADMVGFMPSISKVWRTQLL